jgi:sugar lactone lactonase YvrE
VDTVCNVYIADNGNQAIKKWSVESNVVTTLATGLIAPQSVAVDSEGNVYIADSGQKALVKWVASDGTLKDIDIDFHGLNNPQAVGLDSAGNVYISDAGNDNIRRWLPSDPLLSAAPILSSSFGNVPGYLAVDAAGNVFFGDLTGELGIYSVDELIEPQGSVVATFSGLIPPEGVAVDGSGNVYFMVGSLRKWNAAENTVTVVARGLDGPIGVAVDGEGNVYYGEAWGGAVSEIPNAFVDSTPRLESAAGGTNFIQAVLPQSVNLLPPFAPVSDQPWLRIISISNGMIGLDISANPGPGRTGNVSVLGRSISVTQVSGTSPPSLIALPIQSDGIFRFAFGDDQHSSFTVLSATNLLMPRTTWTEIGTASNIASNLQIFADPVLATQPERYYRVVAH